MQLRSLRPPKVKCICPRCGKVHVVKVFWHGRGKPRIYCKECKEFASKYSHLEDFS